MIDSHLIGLCIKTQMGIAVKWNTRFSGQIGIGIVLILLGAITSVTKTAIENLNEANVRKNAEAGSKKDKLILKFMEKPEGYIDVLELMLMGIGIMIGTFHSLSWIPLFWYFAILFGNILPRKLAVRNPENIAPLWVYITWVITCILTPVKWLLDGSVRVILFLLRINPKELEENMTEEEIISVVNEGHEQGILEDSELEMISNIIELDEKEVKDIMTHRRKIIGISSDLSIDEAIQRMLSEGFSRYPLYKEDIDNIIGILHLKDLMKYYMSQKDREISLKSVAREPYFVPDTQGIDMLFHDMQVKKIHMAVVVDEYGQTAGVVAMEDVLEEIVGNIQDEYDVEEKLIVKQVDGRYLINGLAPLDEIEEELNISIEEEDFDTLNGWIISRLGHIPDEKERVNLFFEGYRFHVLDVRNQMIRYVRVTKEEMKKESSLLESIKLDAKETDGILY